MYHINSFPLEDIYPPISSCPRIWTILPAQGLYHIMPNHQAELNNVSLAVFIGNIFISQKPKKNNHKMKKHDFRVQHVPNNKKPHVQKD